MHGCSQKKFCELKISEGFCVEFGRVFLQFSAFITVNHIFRGV